jgi:pumilio RNA-binding family
LSGKILDMSKHKYASNVIEKGLRFGGPQEQHLMVDEIMTLATGHDALQVYNFYF